MSIPGQVSLFCKDLLHGITTANYWTPNEQELATKRLAEKMVLSMKRFSRGGYIEDSPEDYICIPGPDGQGIVWIHSADVLTSFFKFCMTRSWDCYDSLQKLVRIEPDHFLLIGADFNSEEVDEANQADFLRTKTCPWTGHLMLEQLVKIGEHLNAGKGMDKLEEIEWLDIAEIEGTEPFHQYIRSMRWESINVLGLNSWVELYFKYLTLKRMALHYVSNTKNIESIETAISEIRVYRLDEDGKRIRNVSDVEIAEYLFPGGTIGSKPGIKADLGVETSWWRSYRISEEQMKKLDYSMIPVFKPGEEALIVRGTHCVNLGGKIFYSIE